MFTVSFFITFTLFAFNFIVDKLRSPILSCRFLFSLYVDRALLEKIFRRFSDGFLLSYVCRTGFCYIFMLLKVIHANTSVLSLSDSLSICSICVKTFLDKGHF